MLGYRETFLEKTEIVHLVVIGIIGIGEGRSVSGQSASGTNTHDYCCYLSLGPDARDE